MIDQPALDLETIVSALKREYEDAEDFYTSDIQPEQEAANNYYEAKPFGDEVDGRSQIVMPVVAETIDYMGPSVLRVFLSSDRVIEFEAVSEEDEAGADEATAAIHYNFMREQDGSRILADWLQGGLLEPIGVAKTICETEERVEREQVRVGMDMALALSGDEITQLLGPDAEVEGIADNGDETFTVSIKRTKIAKKFRDVTIPLEEFRFSRNARHEDDADYIAHVSLKTRSELVEMGFDRGQVEDLPVSDGLDVVEQRWDSSRWRDTSELPLELQTVLLCEEYARMDVDGDGIAERVKVFRVGDDILLDAETGEPSIETVTEQPFSVFVSFTRSNRLVGASLASKVMDLQRVESVVARQMQDGMYLANMPRPLIDMSSDYAATTLEDVLRPIAGSPIRYKGQAPLPFQAGMDVSKSLAVLEHWHGVREQRSGITRLNQGLDADTLNKTATGAALMQAQGQQMEEAIARNFGEAFGRLMAKKLRLMKAEGAEFPIKLQQPMRGPDGQQVKFSTANAANWPDDFRLIIRVGLGTGRKEQKLQYLFALGQLMERGFQVGAVDAKGLYRLGSEVVSAMNLGQGDDFFVDPSDPEAQQQQGDPEAAARDAEMQKEMAKAQAKAAGDQMKVQAQMQTAREKLDAEVMLRREEMAVEAMTANRIDDTVPGGALDR